MSHENVFHAEKHCNDAIHNPSRAGTSHTDREIQAAADLIGRDAVVVTATRARREGKRRARETLVNDVCARGEALGDGCVLLGAGGERGGRYDATRKKNKKFDGVVARVDTSALPGGDSGNAERQPSRRRLGVLDHANMWKTEARIVAGGTAGARALRDARAAAKASP